MEKTLKSSGYILRLTPYKESTAIALFLTKDSFLTFQIRGYYKPTNKNPLMELTLVEVLLDSAKGGHYFLKESRLLEAPRLESNLGRLALLNLMMEVSSKAQESLEAPALFSLIEQVLKITNEGYDPLSASLLFLAKITSLLGIAPEVNSCLHCGRKDNLVAFSFNEGGYLCKAALESSDYEPQSKEYLLTVRYIFKAPIEDFGRVAFSKELTLTLLHQLGDYLKDSSGLNIKSLSLLYRL